MSLHRAGDFHAVCLTVVIMTGCGPSGSRPTVTDPPGARPPLLVDEQVSGWDNAAYLVPTRTGDEPDRLAPAEAWRRLGPDLASDPDTVRLMGRLYDGLPVELAALPPTTGKDDPLWLAPPGSGRQVAFRWFFLPSDFADRRQVAGLDVHTGVTTLNYSYVVRVPASPGETAALAGDEPPPGEALGLALEDYFLRHPCGWKSVYVGSVGEDSAFAKVVEEKDRTAAERRADLDRRAEDFAARWRDFLAKRGRR